MSEQNYLDRLKVTKAELDYIDTQLRKRGYKFDKLIKYPKREPVKVHVFQTVKFKAAPYHCHILLPEGISDDSRIVKVKKSYYLMYSKYEDLQANSSSAVTILG